MGEVVQLREKCCTTCDYAELVIREGIPPMVQCFHLSTEAFRLGLVPCDSYCELGWRLRDPKRARRRIAPEVLEGG